MSSNRDLTSKQEVTENEGSEYAVEDYIDDLTKLNEDLVKQRDLLIDELNELTSISVEKIATLEERYASLKTLINKNEFDQLMRYKQHINDLELTNKNLESEVSRKADEIISLNNQNQSHIRERNEELIKVNSSQQQILQSLHTSSSAVADGLKQEINELTRKNQEIEIKYQDAISKWETELHLKDAMLTEQSNMNSNLVQTLSELTEKLQTINSQLHADIQKDDSFKLKSSGIIRKNKAALLEFKQFLDTTDDYLNQISEKMNLNNNRNAKLQ
jgi:hypothetical protein